MKHETLEVSEMMIGRLEAEYPVLDVRQQIRNMQNWWVANPRKRKQPKGEYRFVVNWLNKAYASASTAQVVARVQARAGEQTERVGCWIDGKISTDEFDEFT